MLSLGINHRENLFESTTGFLQALHRKTVEKYPQATIYVPLINFSHNLSAPHQTLLTRLNSFITIKYTLFEIHHSEFHTTHDDIYWTADTASHALQHWLWEKEFPRRTWLLLKSIFLLNTAQPSSHLHNSSLPQF